MEKSFNQAALELIKSTIIIDNDSRAYIYPDINQQLDQKIRKQINLNDDEIILYVYDLNFFANGTAGGYIKDITKGFFIGGTLGIASLFTSNTQYFFAITTYGMYYIPNSEIHASFFVSWEDIENAEPCGDGIVIYVEDGSYYHIVDMNSEITGVHNSISSIEFTNLIHQICNLRNHDSQTANDIIDSWFDLVNHNLSIESVLQFSDDLKKRLNEIDDESESYMTYLTILEILVLCYNILADKMEGQSQAEMIKRANFYINKYLEEEEEIQGTSLFNNMYMLFADIYILKANIMYLSNNSSPYAILQTFYKGYIRRDGTSLLNNEYVLNYRSEYLSEYINSFTSIPYNNRKFLVIDSSLSYLDSDAFKILPKADLPKDIKFPLGHPQELELYICHPYIQDYYIPYETSEFELFKDRMDELRYVLQTMGATRITIQDCNSSEQELSQNSHINVEGHINAKINSGGVNVDIEKEKRSYEQLRREYGTESTYRPTKKPYIPDGLLWYHHEPSWQRLFQERMAGLEKHSITISSTSSIKTDRKQTAKIKADFKALILKVDANLEIEIEEMFEHKYSAEWRLNVEFAPLKTLTDVQETEATVISSQKNSSVHSLEEAKTKYLEEIRFCLNDDGEIDEKERKMLDQIRIKLGIDESIAKELEMTAQISQYTMEEQKYCDTVREYLADGMLTDKDLRLLARLADNLDISEKKADELRKLTIKQYSN